MRMRKQKNKTGLTAAFLLTKHNFELRLRLTFSGRNRNTPYASKKIE